MRSVSKRTCYDDNSVPSCKIFDAFCSETPLICSRVRRGLAIVSQCYLRRSEITLRICDSLYSVVTTIDEELDISCRNAILSLRAISRYGVPDVKTCRTSRAESGVGAPGPLPSSW